MSKKVFHSAAVFVITRVAAEELLPANKGKSIEELQKVLVGSPVSSWVQYLPRSPTEYVMTVPEDLVDGLPNLTSEVFRTMKVFVKWERGPGNELRILFASED